MATTKHPRPIRLDHSAVIWNFLRRPIEPCNDLHENNGAHYGARRPGIARGELTVSLYIMARGDNGLDHSSAWNTSV